MKPVSEVRWNYLRNHPLFAPILLICNIINISILAIYSFEAEMMLDSQDHNFPFAEFFYENNPMNSRVPLSVCVCVRERERERERAHKVECWNIMYQILTCTTVISHAFS